MMDERHETPTPHFSERTDSTAYIIASTTNSQHLDVLDTSVSGRTKPQSHLDVLTTAVPNSTVPMCTSMESPVLWYNSDTTTRILAMANTENEERSLPFLQRIQLAGPGDYTVRATGQVDDGAMRNCISKKRWENYGHCLNPLEPSTTRIRVANGSKITPMGCWTGTVKVGKVGARSSFEVFDCGDAFDVILGKPWLKAVKAKHDYSTDEITISHNGESDIISNSAIDPTISLAQIPSEPIDETPTEASTTTWPTEDTVIESDPLQQLDREWTRIHQLRASKSPWKETR
jgi:hypothetical protein